MNIKKPGPSIGDCEVSVSGRVPPRRTANTKGVLALLARLRSLLSEPSSVMNEIANDISFA